LNFILASGSSHTFTATYDATDDVIANLYSITDNATATITLYIDQTKTKVLLSNLVTTILPHFTTPSAFYLGNDNAMYWVPAGSTPDQLGGVTIDAGDTQTWLSSVPSQSGIVYESGTWTLLVHSPDNWTEVPTVYFGEWDGSQINPAKKYGPFALVGWNATNFTYTMQLSGVPAISIDSGKYLALEITNNSADDETVVTCNRVGGAYLAPPGGLPNWPLPEFASGILMALGLMGLGGFVIARKTILNHR
jgi:hypothetical protein